MRTTRIKNITLCIGLACFLFSCNSSTHFQRDTINTKGIFGLTETDSTNLADTPWQELFADPYLTLLIEEGLNNNADIQIAIQKVMAAEAYFSQSKASLLPAINAFGNGTYTRNPKSIYPDGPRDVNNYQLGAEASWEIDIWGKLRSSKRAAYANLLASDAAKKAVQTRLIANITAAYNNLNALDAKLVITKKTVKNNINLVETMKVLKESGRVTGAAIVQSEAARYAAEVTLPDLEQQIRETENALCLILARVPGNIERKPLAIQIEKQLLETGVPSQLLDNRPDVMQAEYAIMSAFEITNNARTYFYPALTLTASTGFTTTQLDKLLDPASFATSIIGGLTAPIFNKKNNVTRLKVAKTQQEEALISFRNILLTAGQEVNNALGSYEASVLKINLRQQQLTALEKSVDYTKELLNYGSATYTEVLNAQQSLLAAQLNNVNDHQQQLNAVISLYRALGGGWK